ncbi:Hsp33 family molecular chaperone HslO [Virgibacillus oceani]
MQNFIVKTLIYDNQVRLFFVDNTKLINTIYNLNQEANKTLKLLLGKTVSAVSLMSGTLKEEQRVSLQITMSDPKYKVFADTDARGNVRGYLNKGLQNASSDFSGSLGQLIGDKGSIRVIKGSAMNQFTGITDMPYQNIVDDISHYFTQSEQTQTFIGTNLGLDDEGDLLFSNAIFAQLLPDASPHMIDEIKLNFRGNRDFFNDLGKYNGNNMEEKLSELFQGAKFMGSSPVQFFCGCSKEMFYGMLHALNKSEIKQAINKNESIETGCQICGRTYSFNQSELQALL